MAKKIIRIRRKRKVIRIRIRKGPKPKPEGIQSPLRRDHPAIDNNEIERPVYV